MTSNFTLTFNEKTISKSRITSLIKRFSDCKGDWEPTEKIYVTDLKLAESVSDRANLELAESVSDGDSRDDDEIRLDKSIKSGDEIDYCSAS